MGAQGLFALPYLRVAKNRQGQSEIPIYSLQIPVKYCFTILFFLWAVLGTAQAPADTLGPPAFAPRINGAAQLGANAVQARQDSVRKAFVRDSIRTLQVRDSLRFLAERRLLQMADTSRYNRHPYYRFGNPEVRISQVRQRSGKEGLFYGIVVLILLFGLLRNAFGRYLTDLFRIYFRTTLRQRLIKEQVANAPLPSLLFNLLYLFIGALLVVLLLRHFGYAGGQPFWMLFVYSLIALGGIYAIKFLVLKLFGWLLQAQEATDTYIFVVFTTNKVLGILMLPVVLGLAFSTGDTYQAFFALAIVVLCGLFCYRFFLSFVSVQKLVQINLFHFLLFLAALEIAPLLLINKLLMQFFAQTP